MVTMDLFAALVGALATARITRLVTTDRITEAPRNRILLRLEDDGLLSYLLTCSWCASVYIGAGVGAAGAVWGVWSWGAALPLALSFSYVAGYLASREGE